MLKRSLATLLLAAAPLFAQEPVITHSTTATPAQLNAWLDSTDPRLIAWAATLLREHPDPEASKEAAKVLTQRAFSTHPNSTPDAEADLALLDALIQTHTAVSPSLVSELHYHLLPGATALALALPEADRTSLFLSWFRGLGFDQPRDSAAHIAAVYLAQKPPPTYAARLLATITITLEISLTKPGEPFSYREGGIGGGCGDSISSPLTPGWPEIFTYTLEQNGSREDSLPVAQAGTERLSLVRHGTHTAFGSCNGVGPLTSDGSYALLSTVLGHAPHWFVDPRRTIEWHTKAQVDREIGSLVTEQNDLFLATARELKQRGLLTPDELSNIVPTMSVTLHRSPLLANH